MENDKICFQLPNCPIYEGLLKSNAVLIKTLKGMYCDNGKEGREKCKRFQIFKIADTCSIEILPNSKLSVAEITHRIQQNQ